MFLKILRKFNIIKDNKKIQEIDSTKNLNLDVETELIMKDEILSHEKNLNVSKEEQEKIARELRIKERTKHIDFEKIYNGSYFFVPDESDSEEIKANYVNEYHIHTQTTAVEDDFVNRIKPMPSNSKVFESSYQFSEDEMEDIKKGWHSRGMNDRWFLYYKNDKLLIHRNTGECEIICSFRNIDDSAELFQVETYDRYFPSEVESKFDGSFKFWVPYLINGLLINFRRALINPYEVYTE